MRTVTLDALTESDGHWYGRLGAERVRITFKAPRSPVTPSELTPTTLAAIATLDALRTAVRGGYRPSASALRAKLEKTIKLLKGF